VKAGAPLALLAALAAACGETPPREPPAATATHAGWPLAGALAGHDCLVVVLDALGARHLGCYGNPRPVSPRIDALAAGGVLFERAWAQTSWTLPSTASLMTGLFQESHGVLRSDHALDEAAATLAEDFAAAGYETAAFSQNPFVSARFGLAQGFGTFEEGLDEGPAFTDAVLAALRPAPGRRLRFVYAHFRRPHAPYDPEPAEREALVTPGYSGPASGGTQDIHEHNGGARPLTAPDVAHLRELYEAGLATVDREVGRLLDALDPARTLVLVLADHGEAFAEHGLLGHNHSAFEEVVHVPSVWSHPALRGGRRVDTPVMSLDVRPTLAVLFGLRGDPQDWQGRPLTPELSGEPGPERTAIFSSSRFRKLDWYGGVTDGRYKLVRSRRDGQEWLFDLQEDPHEQRHLGEQAPPAAARLRQVLDAWEAGLRPRLAPRTLERDTGVDEALRQLGYVGGDR
jgi:arylsulfatase A-like enzyme